MNRYSLIAACGLLFLFVFSAGAQSLSFNYFYSFEPAMADQPPQLSGLDVDYPEAARKNGVEGTVKATATLGEDGRVHDIAVVRDLPFGVGDAVSKALAKWYFKPATLQGKPVPVKMTLDYVVAAVYGEDDKNVSKPQIIEKPPAVYPPSQMTERLKGSVSVRVMFFSEGKMKVVGVSSVMPKEFDKAAMAAAENIRFRPAIHKKSKKAVSQEMIVQYDFKP